MEHSELAAERAYLAATLEKLEEAAMRLLRSAEEAEADYSETVEEIWERGRHIIRDFDDFVNVYVDSQTVGAVRRSADIVLRELRDVQSMRDAPYFGRVDFHDRMAEETLRVYIGRRAFMDEAALEFYVYDWRSPIASMFYDFDKGPASYESPGGVRDGTITLKRQLRVSGGELRQAYDADALNRDAILGELLSRGAGRQLRDIAQSIQREQNTAIRFLAPRNMLITGPAGSGKTSVGLHHIAYLLYHNRGKLSSGEIVAVSANNAFNEYIAGILPDLYEADIQRRVFADLIKPALPRDLRVGSYYEQTEYLLEAKEDDSRARWISGLYSLDFLDFLTRFVDETPIVPEELRYRGDVIATREAFADYLEKGNSATHIQRIARADHFIREQVEDYFVRNRQAIRRDVERRAADEELDLYTQAEVTRYIRASREACIRCHGASVRRRSRLDAAELLARACEAFFADQALPRELRARLRRSFLYFEDALALLCVKALLGGIAPQEGIRYALVDEAQDYAPMQHFLLRRMFPRAAFVLLADTDQAVLPALGIADEALFAKLYPGALHHFRLSKSYRSTEPISALAAAVLGKRDADAYYLREGTLPVLHRSADIAKAAAAVARMPFEGTTAVLARTRREAEALYAAIGGDVDARLVTETADADLGTVSVLPLFLAKGLEFDRVIVACSGDKEDAVSSRAMYLMCTRALHELHMICGGEIPPALAGLHGCYFHMLDVL